MRLGQQLQKRTNHELLNAEGEGGRVEQDLPLFGQEAQHLLHHRHEVLRQQLVSLEGCQGTEQQDQELSS